MAKIGCMRNNLKKARQQQSSSEQHTKEAVVAEAIIHIQVRMLILVISLMISLGK